MDNLECLENEAYEEGIDIVHYNFDSDQIKGLYMDGVIALNQKLETTREKTCILAEELGHHETSFGNILDQTVTANRKQEYKARIWAYKKIISPEDLLEEALTYFKTHYPEGLRRETYMIHFTPNLRILMFFD